MGTKDLPADVQAFYEAYIDSVELLHVLRMLHERRRERWTFAAISEELRSSEGSVAKRIHTLIQRKLIDPSSLAGSEVRYAPFDDATDALVGRSLEFYKDHSYRIIDIIFSKPTHAIQSIADAFRFRKDD